MSGVKISYGDIAVGARDSFVPSATKEEYFSKISDISKSNLVYKNFGNPIDLYSVLLDGSAEIMPNRFVNENIGYWSSVLSGYDGAFEEPIIMTIKAEKQFTSSGFTLTFDKYFGIYPTRVGIEWYRLGELISQGEFYPNSPEYFFSKKVENYDEVVFKFYSINMPKNRLKIRGIEYGVGTEFSGSEIMNTSAIFSLNPLSAEIPINTFDFVLNNRRGVEYSFQEGQTIRTYFDDNLVCTTFMKSAKKKSRNVWDIKTEDYFGTMDSAPFFGGVYENKSVSDLIFEIFSSANVPYVVEADIDGFSVSGYIPYTNCRNALQQVLFAIGLYSVTYGSEIVKIVKTTDDAVKSVGLNRIMQGQTVDDEARPSAISVSYHSYKKSNQELSVEVGDVGENILVVFGEPLYDLYITNGEIVSSGSNHAIINAEENCIIVGKKYDHSSFKKTKYYSSNGSAGKENVVSVENATLVTKSNIDNVAEMCYNYFGKARSVSSDIIEGKHVKYGSFVKYGERLYGSFVYGRSKDEISYDEKTKIGDIIDIETASYGTIRSQITKQSFNLNGGIIVKKTVSR